MRFIDTRGHQGRRLATRLAHLRGEPLVVLGLPAGRRAGCLRGGPGARRATRRDRGPQARGAVPTRARHGRHRRGRRADRHQRGRRPPGVSATSWPRSRHASAPNWNAGRGASAATDRVWTARANGRRRRRRHRHRGDGYAPPARSRAHGANRVVLAVPVAPPDWTARIGGDADEFITSITPEPFVAIGKFYVDFCQTSDQEVATCLAQPPPNPQRRRLARKAAPRRTHHRTTRSRRRPVRSASAEPPRRRRPQRGRPTRCQEVATRQRHHADVVDGSAPAPWTSSKGSGHELVPAQPRHDLVVDRAGHADQGQDPVERHA